MKNILLLFSVLLIFIGCDPAGPMSGELIGAWVTRTISSKTDTANQHTLFETILKLKEDRKGIVRFRNLSIDSSDSTKNFSTAVEYPITWSTGVKGKKYFLAMTKHHGKVVEINAANKLKTEMILMNQIDSSYGREDTLDFSKIQNEIIWYQKNTDLQIKMIRVTL